MLCTRRRPAGRASFDPLPPRAAAHPPLPLWPQASVELIATVRERKPWSRPPLSMSFQVGWLGAGLCGLGAGLGVGVSWGVCASSPQPLPRCPRASRWGLGRVGAAPRWQGTGSGSRPPAAMPAIPRRCRQARSRPHASAGPHGAPTPAGAHALCQRRAGAVPESLGEGGWPAGAAAVQRCSPGRLCRCSRPAPLPAHACCWPAPLCSCWLAALPLARPPTRALPTPRDHAQSSYKVDKWVRKLCKSGDYQIRL